MSLYPQVQKLAPPTWTYLIGDLRTNLILEEIPLSGVRWSKRLNDSGTLSGTWQLGPSEIRNAYLLTTPARSTIFVLRDSQPIWAGIIWTRSYDSVSQRLTIGCADFWSYFDHRKVLSAFNPVGQDVSYVAARQTSYTQIDQNQIARNLVQQAQAASGPAGSAGNVWVTFDTTTSGTLRDRNYYGYELSNVGDMLRNLANVIDGPDMLFDVQAKSSDFRPKVILRIGTPLLGQQGARNVWDVGGNVISYTWPSDGSRMATRAFAVGDGSEKGLLVGYKENVARYSAGWPLLETEKAYDTVTIPQTLFDHAAADVATARSPVVLPTLRVRGDMLPRLSDFSIGDGGLLVIPPGDVFHRAGLNAAVRVIAMDVRPDSEGGDDVSLTCAPLSEDVI